MASLVTGDRPPAAAESVSSIDGGSRSGKTAPVTHPLLHPTANSSMSRNVHPDPGNVFNSINDHNPAWPTETVPPLGSSSITDGPHPDPTKKIFIPNRNPTTQAPLIGSNSINGQ
ncbi:hypothetical protein ACLOJK_003643 [Asimina triloba]